MSQPLSLQAVFLGKSPEFQAWAAKRMQPGAVPSEELARKYVCLMCRIDSRAELNTSATAAKNFTELLRCYRRSIAQDDSAHQKRAVHAT